MNIRKEHNGIEIWFGKKWIRGGKKEHSTGTLGESILINNGSDVSELKYPKNIIEFSNADRTKNIHPTQKASTLGMVKIYLKIILTSYGMEV